MFCLFQYLRTSRMISKNYDYNKLNYLKNKNILVTTNMNLIITIALSLSTLGVCGCVGVCVLLLLFFNLFISFWSLFIKTLFTLSVYTNFVINFSKTLLINVIIFNMQYIVTPVSALEVVGVYAFP